MLVVLVATAPAAPAATDNEKAANGPIPGDVSLYVSEIACSQKRPTPGYYPSFSQDASWVVRYLQPGQSDGTAPSIIGDWVAIQTNGIGSKTIASSVVAINQHDPKRIASVFPFGALGTGQQSFAPPKNGSDAANNMVYSQDLGVGKVAGIKLDPETDELKTAFVVDDRTTCLVALLGPRDQRIMITSNQRHDFPFQPMMLALGTGLYKEQARWREAATGRLIAESDLFEPMFVNTLVTPGFGGRLYCPTDKGFIVLQVEAAK